jgi:gamma-polyglutamate synthase
MQSLYFLSAVTLLIVILGIAEYAAHKKNLKAIPVRIHVNGTRGKSSVTRLIAAGLREAGIKTCAKTTGTLPRMILTDGRELPVFRPSRPNIIEQTRIVAAAAAHGADALVIECMALQPELQWLSESRLIRATHAVITNAREDHLDVMGPDGENVARSLAGMIPAGGKLFTAERRYLPILTEAAGDRDCRVANLNEEEIAAVSEKDLSEFSYTEHAENVALALCVCRDLGVEREIALRGMKNVTPDPGALTEHAIDFFGKKIVFVNAFAANDPESTARIWTSAQKKYEGLKKKIAIFNCRADRPDRSLQLGRACAGWPPMDHLVLIGTGTYIFVRAAVSEGVEMSKIVYAEDRRVDEIFESVMGLVDSSALVMGMGNIGGQGLDIVRYFRNREAPRE